MLLGTVLGFDALTFNFVLLRAQCLRAMGRIKRGAVGMPKRNKIKREPVEAVETVPSPPQEAVEEAAAEPEVQVQQQRRREVPWALAKRMTTKMKKMRKRHERYLKTFRKQEAGWEQRREVFARLDEAKQKAIRKHGGLNKIGWDALAEINQESSLRYVRKYCLEKEALKATQNQLSLQLGWHDVEREWLLGQVECLRMQNRELRAVHGHK